MKKSIIAWSVAIGFSAITAAASGGVASADDHVIPVTAPAAAQAPAPVKAPAATAIGAQDARLKYEQAGSVVTITRNAAPVATVTLTSADYSARSAKVVLSVAAARPFTVDPRMFTLYDAQGWENDPVQAKPVRFETGKGTLTLTFTGTPARPEALGWVPLDGEAAVAVWERA
ncbi:hypothetical protein [Actinoplanes sp. M2I2]|uniref:hypothetical protein n=1 Tax=Actinoplanes sp. M2I2 TaxID=1734444 RepID=UPI002021AB36|nr:hypothetical protein [Actinoplanes sp. M2I2]